jgi:hypothetical protein
MRYGPELLEVNRRSREVKAGTVYIAASLKFPVFSHLGTISLSSRIGPRFISKHTPT